MKSACVFVGLHFFPMLIFCCMYWMQSMYFNGCYTLNSAHRNLCFNAKRLTSDMSCKLSTARNLYWWHSPCMKHKAAFDASFTPHQISKKTRMVSFIRRTLIRHSLLKLSCILIKVYNHKGFVWHFINVQAEMANGNSLTELFVCCLPFADRFTVYSAKKLRQAWNK